MKLFEKLFIISFLLIFITGCGSQSLENNKTIVNKTDENKNKEGEIMGSFVYNDVEIKWLGQSAFKIKAEKIVYIDPFNVNDTDKADIILITHEHFDHCSIADIKKIIKPDTIILTVADCQSKLASIAQNVKNISLVVPGKKINIGTIKIEAVPAYNIGKMFHSMQNQWVGFILEMNNVKIYHAGDTDLIPEMSSVNVDIALLPVGGTYTMTAKEAGQACSKIKAKYFIPMHYGSVVGSKSDADIFRQNCSAEVKIL
jgi:L-ascorbate metabolism protein UlaG (beta-lactamase superfamily)